ncbi:MAG: phosphate ABC transporter substrate-binding protein [Sandaracinaceae bacterium]|nr:phosphate ABC transporter substrate-binding protein [Sandaracinaceae bacterium]
MACSGGHRNDQAPAPSASGESPSAPAAPSRMLTLKDSDTMVILAQRFAEAYMRTHPGTTIQVSGGGSGVGIAALLNGTTDIANSSRPMKDEEKARLRETRHQEVAETRVALDALAVYVHSANPVQQLTLEQLSQIYTGRVSNWRDVGGPDMPIVLYSRENNSGTYAFFKEHVLRTADFAANAQTLPGTAAVINAVSRDRGGIGYGGIAYGEGIRHVKLAGADGQAIEPSLENATSGRYPLSRFLLMYTAGNPSALAADFLRWVGGVDAQRLVEVVGYYPLPGVLPPSAGTTPTPPPAVAPSAAPAAPAAPPQ